MLSKNRVSHPIQLHRSPFQTHVAYHHHSSLQRLLISLYSASKLVVGGDALYAVLLNIFRRLLSESLFMIGFVHCLCSRRSAILNTRVSPQAFIR